MVAVYQLIFFLSIGMTAVAIAVFVLAVSLLGRAIKLAVDEQGKTEKEHMKSNVEELEKIQIELDRAKKEGKHPDMKRLEKALNILKKKKRLNTWKLKWINTKPKLLGSIWGAFVPGAFFMTSAIICIIAIIKGDGIPQVYPYMWIAIATMGVGIGFVCLSLRVIEGVARISEEVGFQRDVSIFKTSLREFEEDRRTELVLYFTNISPPFNVKVNSETKINFYVTLTKGEYADNVQVFFFVPQGFDFPDRETVVQREDHGTVPGYITTAFEFEESILSTIRQPGSIVIKAPPTADEYPLYYRVICKRAHGKHEKFGIVVEEEEAI